MFIQFQLKDKKSNVKNCFIKICADKVMTPNARDVEKWNEKYCLNLRYEYSQFLLKLACLLFIVIILNCLLKELFWNCIIFVLKNKWR